MEDRVAIDSTTTEKTIQAASYTHTLAKKGYAAKLGLITGGPYYKLNKVY
jgi:hypothetical protein